ncbi:hypothetical protein ACHHYP_20454 [Achlya hypogyna]|uniref:Uncharacterized protein n=1 Tax=Achlya hypogyna TaxID=1202772 RepID=A0A1V9ZIJ8_ACHHY|nr:hypothetical protein ACHHYP_20454 [Achlya hypogyna]
MSSRRQGTKPPFLSMSSEGLAGITFTVSDKRPKSAHRPSARKEKRDSVPALKASPSPPLRKAKTTVSPGMLAAATSSKVLNGSFRKSTAWSEKHEVSVGAPATSQRNEQCKPRVRVDPNPRHASASPPKDASPSPPNKAYTASAHPHSPHRFERSITRAIVVDHVNAVADIERTTGAKWNTATGFVNQHGLTPEDGMKEAVVQPSTRASKRPAGVGARHQRSLQQSKHVPKSDTSSPRARWI